MNRQMMYIRAYNEETFKAVAFVFKCIEADSFKTSM
jgi:hypothetical protein